MQTIRISYANNLQLDLTIMSSPELDIRVAQATNQISQMKQAHQTSGEMLGIPTVSDLSSEYTGRNHIESRTLSDQSQLIEVDTLVSGMINELPIGSIIGITSVKASLQEIPEQFVSQYETIGAKLADSPLGSIFWGVVRTDNQGKQLPWRTYRVGEQTVSEKNDVIQSIQSLLNPRKGIEATQIFSALLASNPNELSKYQGRNLSGAGCFSHDKPKQAIPINILLGSATPLPKPIVIGHQNPHRFIRAYLDQDYSLSPLAHPAHETYDQNHVLRVALVHQSEKIAKENNPRGLGAGTSAGVVLEAIYATTEELPELIGNQASIPQAQQIFKNKIK